MLLCQIVQSHFDHADGALHDLLPGRDHRLGLLPPQHGLLSPGVGQVRQPRFLDSNPALSGRSCSVGGPARHFVETAPQSDFVVFTVIVCVLARQMTHADSLWTTPRSRHIEHRLRRLTRHDRRNLDRVAALVVHFESLAVEVARTQ